MDDPVTSDFLGEPDADFPQIPGEDLEEVTEEETGKVAMYDPEEGNHSEWISFYPDDLVAAKP